MRADKIPPMEAGCAEDRAIYVDGEKFLLPAVLTGRRGPISMEQLERVAKNMQMHILITGETGTGKESLARHIGNVAEISAGKWGSVNCASLTPELADSELFGHVKGAFTSANEARLGILCTHAGGAVFLDEIGALSEATQRKLLRFLDSHELRPVGADRDKKVVTRIIAATNANLEDALIHDLPPRFQFEVALPPLRERLDDIPLLLSDRRFLGDGRTFTGISWRTLCALFMQEFPKNMRDLHNLCLDWVHGCSSGVYVLDDYSIMGKDAQVWARFASFALAAIEKHVADKGVEALQSDGALELCALLFGIIGDEGGSNDILAIRICDMPGLVGQAGRLFGIQILREALCEASTDFCYPVTDPLKTSSPLLTLGEVIPLIKGWVEIYRRLEKPSRIELVAGHDMSSLRQRYKEPGWAFKTELRTEISKAWHWPLPEPPADAELEDILDEMDIDDELRRVCRYCAEGLSNPKIATQPDISKSVSWIQEELQKLRSDDRLARLLPVARSGRRASS